MIQTQVATDATIAHITKKEGELKQIALKLKSDFIGLDNVVDKIIENIKIWYIFPELQLRPTILCLWGLTGVGKTDLVRKMISYMNKQSSFMEIEMNGEKGIETIQKKLEESSIEATDQCVLFIDEFQKFRTTGEDGSTNAGMAFSDIWTILSDGKFHANLTNKTTIMDELLNARYYKDYNESYEENNPKNPGDKLLPAEPIEIKRERLYKSSLYMARRIKRLLKLETSLEELMKMETSKLMDMLEVNMTSNSKIFEGETYKKMLIIISGNLDEAYKMANNVSDSDLDADFYHDMSKRITVVNIKDALRKRFKPEQIARLGNSHILYPSLSRDNYYKIIALKCKEINDVVYKTTGISITLDSSVYDVIYNNGVFPTQGVRPLLSTITNMLSTAFPTFIFDCLINKVNHIKVYVEKNIMSADILGKVISIEIPVVLDAIRAGITNDEKHVVAVHELGHAVVYGLLYGVAPRQVCLNTTSPFTNGFILPHEALINKDMLLKKVQILLAGRVAEEIVFGNKYSSIGAQNDIHMATACIWSYIAKLGFDGFVGAVSQKNDDGNIFDQTIVSAKCEEMMKEAKVSTNELLSRNIPLFKRMLSYALSTGEMSGNDIVRFFGEFGIALGTVDDGDQLDSDYKGMTEKFLEV